MNGWDGVRAWRFIRASGGYRKAWRRHNPPPGLPEQAPFPVRLQTGVDLAALEWGMFAWEGPLCRAPDLAVLGPARGCPTAWRRRTRGRLPRWRRRAAPRSRGSGSATGR